MVSSKCGCWDDGSYLKAGDYVFAWLLVHIKIFKDTFFPNGYGDQNFTQVAIRNIALDVMKVIECRHLEESEMNQDSLKQYKIFVKGGKTKNGWRKNSF